MEATYEFKAGGRSAWFLANNFKANNMQLCPVGTRKYFDFDESVKEIDIVVTTVKPKDPDYYHVVEFDSEHEEIAGEEIFNIVGLVREEGSTQVSPWVWSVDREFKALGRKRYYVSLWA